jgi:heat shock protein HslJ
MITLALATTFTACVSLAAPPATTEPAAQVSTAKESLAPMIGIWVLGSASGLDAIPGGVTLSIRKHDGLDAGSLHIGGFSGINYYSSDALIDGSQHRFILSSKLASTEKWGPKPGMSFEKAYLGKLDGVVEYRLGSAQDLTLTTLNGDTLQFHKVSN